MLALYQRIVDVDHMKYLVNMFEMLLIKNVEICKKCECHANESIYNPYSMKLTQLGRTLLPVKLTQNCFSDRTN